MWIQFILFSLFRSIVCQESTYSILDPTSSVVPDYGDSYSDQSKYEGASEIGLHDEKFVYHEGKNLFSGRKGKMYSDIGLHKEKFLYHNEDTDLYSNIGLHDEKFVYYNPDKNLYTDKIGNYENKFVYHNEDKNLKLKYYPGPIRKNQYLGRDVNYGEEPVYPKYGEPVYPKYEESVDHYLGGGWDGRIFAGNFYPDKFVYHNEDKNLYTDKMGNYEDKFVYHNADENLYTDKIGNYDKFVYHNEDKNLFTGKIGNYNEKLYVNYGEEPVDPKYEEPVDPKYEEPVDPKYEEPVDPKYEEPVDPKYEEPVDPKYEEPVDPKYEEPVDPNLEGDRDAKLFAAGNVFSMGNLAQGEIIKQALDYLNYWNVPGVPNVNTILGPGTIYPYGSKNVEASLNVVDVVNRIVNPKEAKQKKIPGVEPCRNGDGVCTSLQTCLAKGGQNIGSCSNCVSCSVCCKYTAECEATTDHFISHWKSDNYPKGQRTSSSCSLTVQIRNEVCQLRLDFLDFVMAAPLDCACRAGDSLEIINSHKGTGILGPGNSRLCGINTGNHIYQDVTPGDLFILKTTTSGVKNVPYYTPKGVSFSGDTAYRWNVKITQIPCESIDTRITLDVASGLATATRTMFADIPPLYEDLRAPGKCLQYYDEGRGEIESFAFDSRSRMMTNLDYSICFKLQSRQCGMTLKAQTFSVGADPSRQCQDGDGRVANGSHCCEVKDGEVNYLALIGYGDGNTIGGQTKANQKRYYFCGQKLGRTNTVVSRNKGQQIIRVKTSNVCCDERSTSGVCPDGGCTGFRINWDMDTGTC